MHGLDYLVPPDTRYGGGPICLPFAWAVLLGGAPVEGPGCPNLKHIAAIRLKRALCGRAVTEQCVTEQCRHGGGNCVMLSNRWIRNASAWRPMNWPGWQRA